MKRILSVLIMSVILAGLSATVALAEQKPGWVETYGATRPHDQRPIWVNEQRPGWVETNWNPNGSIVPM